MNMPSRNVIVAGIISLVGTIAALIFGLSFTGHLDANSVPLVTEMLGIVVTTIPALLALNSAEKAKDAANNAQQTAEQTNHDIRNGILKSKVVEAIVEAASSPTIPITTGEATTPAAPVLTPESNSATSEGNSNG